MVASPGDVAHYGSDVTTAGGGRPELHQTEIDGVACVWTNAPGHYTGGLSLRVGHADEPLPQRGITHMLEHLALFGLDRPGEHSNGNVGPTTLNLHSTGTPEEVGQFLTRAAAQLVAPPVSRLEDEKGVLRAESAHRAPSALGELVAWRWGTSPFGREATPEYGRGHLTADDLLAWANTYATRQNAVLWFTGPPPAGLEIALHDGVRHLLPDPYESPLPTFPAYFRSTSGSVGLHCLLPRGAEGVALGSILRARLVDDLRTRRAAAYSPEAAYRPLTGEVAELVALSDAVEGRLSDVAWGVIGALTSLGDPAAGPTPEELETHRRQARMMLEGPDAATGLMTSSAWDVLHGARTRTIDEILEGLAHLTPEDVRAAAVEAERTALAQWPQDQRAAPWPAAPLSPSAPVTGGRTFPQHGGGTALTVADAGLTVTTADAHVTVRHDGLAAVMAWDDGGRVLIGDDGVQVVVEPTMLRDGTEALRLIDAAVPPEKVVPLGSRAADQIPRASLRHRAERPLRLVAVATVAAIVGGLLIAGGLGALAPAVVIVAGMAGVRAWRED